MRLGELRARPDAELLVETPTDPVEEPERVRLLAAAGQRQHQPRVRGLVERVTSGQLLEV